MRMSKASNPQTWLQLARNGQIKRMKEKITGGATHVIEIKTLAPTSFVREHVTDRPGCMGAKRLVQTVEL
jgi:hypothetical protein